MCLLEQQLKDEKNNNQLESYIKKPINLGNQIWEGGQFPRPFWGVARSHASARGVLSPVRSLEARFARHNRPL